MRFHREVNTKMAAAEVSKVNSEQYTMRYIISGLDNHPKVGHFAKIWRATVHPHT